VTDDALLDGRYASRRVVLHGTVTERAVQTEPHHLLAVVVEARVAVRVAHNIDTGMDRVRECDRLLGALIEPEDRDWIAQPGSDDEGEGECGDCEYSQSAEGQEGYQDLEPCGSCAVLLFYEAEQAVQSVLVSRGLPLFCCLASMAVRARCRQQGP
jgi:hypothetical protein